MPQSFQDLRIWQLSRELSLGVYKLSAKFPKEELFGLTSQLRRSSVSVGANIAESFGRYQKNDKIQLLIIARGSIYETRSHLSIAGGLGYITSLELNKIDSSYETLSRQLNKFISSIRTNN